MSVLWTDDRQKRGSPSSMDLLMYWLLTPGNYEMWESNRKKLPIAEGIVVYFKMHNLKRTYKSVKKWLEDKQQLELFFSGKAAKKVESAVFKRCPHFLDLSPVFENVGHTSTAAEGEEHEENVAEGANELNEEDGGSVEDTGGAQGKRKRQGVLAHVQASEGSSRSRRLRRRWPFPPPTNPGCKILVFFSNANRFWRILMEIAIVMLKHKEDLAKVRLDAEKKLAEVRTKLETMLSRQKLKSAGYSDEDVNGIFPL
ncbi:hypothetical protein GQ600_23576 [Phytophthora cactorum]|nr:hypothetical protein GQ600_23576 [Phytophthora cactorum]